MEYQTDRLIIQGNGLHGLNKPLEQLNAGNSGTTMRLLSGVLVGQHFLSTIIGDSSLCQRPMKRIIEPLQQMGASIYGTKINTAPITIEPVSQLHGIHYELPIPSAQVKSAIIFAGLYADSVTTIYEKVQSRDHTERMLGLQSLQAVEGRTIEVRPNMLIAGKKYFVPGDISAAAFLISAALIVPSSELRILDVGLNPTRIRILEILKVMGGNIQIENERIVEGEPIGDLIVKSSELNSNIDLRGSGVVELIDEIPILSITALFAKGTFCLHDARELRTKETDRLSAIVHNLRLLGCQVEEYEDGFAFEGNKNLTGNNLNSFGDHRIAMAFGIAGLRVPNVTIQNADCVDISFPGFWHKLLSTPID